MAASWQVTGQAADQYETDGAGNPVTGYRVSFITGAGNRGSVFVPNDQYKPETVKTLIQAQANTMDAIGALKA